MGNLVLGIVLGLYVGIGQVLSLSGLAVQNVLWAGVVGGLCVGAPEVGLAVGAQCLLMSLGFFTYGGATIPDYTVGALLGTVVAASTLGNDPSANVADVVVTSGIPVATAVALLMSQMDILGRATTTVFQHLGESALAKNNVRLFETWTLCGTLPWILSRAIPVFVCMLLLDQLTLVTDFVTSVQWIANGLGVVGAALPAVGFALLLSYMDIKKYWPFMIIGYVGFGYLAMNTISLALVGAALGGLFMSKYVGGAE